MNLKELREEVNAQLDYNPDLKQYRDIVSRVINRHYLQISSQYPWLFMQERHDIVLRPDVDGTTASASDSTLYIQRDSTNQRKIEFYEASSGGSAVTTGVSFFAKSAGQTLIVTIDSEDYEFLIVEDSGTSFYVEPALGYDTELPSSLSSTRTTDWKIEYRTYALPRRCVEILGVSSRDDDRGRLVFIDSKKEELLHLDRDNTGDAIVLVEEMSQIDAPPTTPVVLTQVSGSSDLPNSDADIDYCYTFVRAGRESAPSPVASIRINILAPLLLPANIEITDMVSTSIIGTVGVATLYPTGTRKRLYRRVGHKRDDEIKILAENRLFRGAWVWVSDVASADSTFTDTGKRDIWPTLDMFSMVHGLDEPGPQQYIRIYRTPSAKKTVEARIAVRPTRMVADGDQPLWPGQYHHLLVYRTLADLCLMHGMESQANTYENRSEVLMKRMKDKYLSRTDRPYIRGSFDRGLHSYRERWGTPLKS